MTSDSSIDISSKKLFELFNLYKRSRFLFVEPGGNCGDYLIYKGAQKLAGIAGLSYETVSHNQFMVGEHSPADVIYIHGSGGFVPWWSGTPAIELRRALLSHSGAIIVGPSTFAIDSDYLFKNVIDPLLGKKAGDIYVFCREWTSYFFLKSFLPSFVNLEIDHDTALNLDPSDFELRDCKRKFVGFFIRNDKESDNFLPALNSISLDPGSYTSDFNKWVQLHACAKKIYTNRLHSSILGTILGKNVILLPNSFHKNRSVWEYSLRTKSVSWKEEVDYGRFSRLMLENSFSTKILASYKVRTVIKKIIYGV